MAGGGVLILNAHESGEDAGHGGLSGGIEFRELFFGVPRDAAGEASESGGAVGFGIQTEALLAGFVVVERAQGEGHEGQAAALPGGVGSHGGGEFAIHEPRLCQVQFFDGSAHHAFHGLAGGREEEEAPAWGVDGFGEGGLFE